MREIEFRGKHTETGKRVYGYLSFIYVKGMDENGFKYTDKAQIYSQVDCKNYEVVLDTVGQFTGMKDKTGKKIYEGDIIGYHLQDKRITDLVYWDIGMFRCGVGINAKQLYRIGFGKEVGQGYSDAIKVISDKREDE